MTRLTGGDRRQTLEQPCGTSEALALSQPGIPVIPCGAAGDLPGKVGGERVSVAAVVGEQCVGGQQCIVTECPESRGIQTDGNDRSGGGGE